MFRRRSSPTHGRCRQSRSAGISRRGRHQDPRRSVIPGFGPDGQNPTAFFAQMLFDLITASQKVIDERRGEPGDDLVTALMEARSDGERVDGRQRSSMSWMSAVHRRHRHDPQHVDAIALQTDRSSPEFSGRCYSGIRRRIDRRRWRMWSVGLAGWLITFVRRATRNTEVQSAFRSPRATVALWYLTANRDETVFEKPLKKIPREWNGSDVDLI